MRALSLTVLICMLMLSARSQDLPVSGTFSNSTVEDFARQIEAQTPYRFYFDPVVFDSLRVSLSVERKPLNEVLRQLFAGTNYYFSLDHRNRLYLTKDRQIVTNIADPRLSDGSIPALANTSVNNSAQPLPDDDSAVATAENKLYTIGTPTGDLRGNAVVSGFIRDSQTGEYLVGTAIYIEQPRIGATTNQFGFFSLTLPKGGHTLNIRAMGVRDTHRKIMLYGDGTLNIDVRPEITSLREVIVSAEKMANIRDVQLGVEKLNITTIKRVPTVFGEADVMRVVLSLPGVKSVGEVSSGFNVRGGAADQNLILFNDATIYNPTHFFGMFSAFNPEIVKDIELYKSSIPARFGGRLSSVLDVNAREGERGKITGTAGIGLITTRLNVEGPLFNDRTTFIFGGRTTYSNWLLDILPSKANYKGSTASFSDLNLGLNHQINDRNDIHLTGYWSDDQSNLNTDTIFGYQNKNLVLKWRHVFSEKLIGSFSGGVDAYTYNNHSLEDKATSYNLDFGLRQLNLKSNFNYYLNSRHTIDFGLSTINYRLKPGSLTPRGEESIVLPDMVQAEQGQESAVYVGNRFELSPALSVDFGLRYSMFNYLGPKQINNYLPGQPKSAATLTGTSDFGAGKVINTYHGPEARLSMRYALTEDFSVKAGYNTLRQYIHMLSNTTGISPTDIWKLSDPHIRPQSGDQISLGLYKNFKANTIETSVEGYFKNIRDYLDYRSGATLVMNHDIENALFRTRGKAYGLEFMVRKPTGKFNGWLSYTYSRTLLQQDDANAGEVINGGDWYPSNYDKPHDLTLISNFRISHRISMSFNTTYSTGRPVTVPVGKYYYAGAFRALYSGRNDRRVPDYFRMDYSINIDGNHRLNQRTHNFWTIGVYNLTGRKNAYSTYFVSEGQDIKGYKLSVFGSIVPFINYNIKF